MDQSRKNLKGANVLKGPLIREGGHFKTLPFGGGGLIRECALIRSFKVRAITVNDLLKRPLSNKRLSKK